MRESVSRWTLIRTDTFLRLTYGDRIVLTLCLSEQQIILLDIGTHDNTYR